VMKICALLGSPRRRGNTACVLEWVLDTALRDGHETEVIPLYERRIAGCSACFACEQFSDRPGCVLDDDMQALYGKILAADVIVLASPVYCYGLTGVLKLVLDRWYALMKRGADGSYVPLIKGKRCGLVVTAGSDASGGADLVVDAYTRICAGFQLLDCGQVVLTEVGGKRDVLNSGVEAEARRLGRRLVAGEVSA